MAITCSVDGTGLAWAQPDGSTIGLFRQTSAVGSGFSDDSVNCSQAGRARAAGILEDISPIYISTVILTPLSPDCVSLSLTCKSIGKPEMNITYKVAGKPPV